MTWRSPTMHPPLTPIHSNRSPMVSTRFSRSGSQGRGPSQTASQTAGQKAEVRGQKSEAADLRPPTSDLTHDASLNRQRVFFGALDMLSFHTLSPKTRR